MATKDIKLPVLFTEITWEEALAERYGKINTQNIVLKAMSLITAIAKDHNGKIVETGDNLVFCTFPNTKKAIQAACTQQRTVQAEKVLGNLKLSLKIGLHYGTVTLSKDNVTGEAVNIARKVRQAAKAQQILLTQETVPEVPTALNIRMVKRGKLKVQERFQKLTVFEAIWEEQAEEHTVFLDEDVKNRPSQEEILVLKYQGKKYKLGKSRSSFLFGRSNENDIIIDDTSISRNHAAIKFFNGKFKLIDQSTNGTYLQTKSKQDHYLHQDEMMLKDKGVISLGRKIEKKHPLLIYYAVLEK